MTRDDIIRMAREAGFVTDEADFIYPPKTPRRGVGLEIERVAVLAAAEKEQQMIRDGWRQCAEGQRTTQYCGLLDAAVKAEREKVAAWMRSKNYATGHGDTIDDLLKEMEWQVAEREREACAKLCDEKYEAVPKNDPYAEADGDYSDLIYAGAAQDCAEAIRARNEQEQPR